MLLLIERISLKTLTEYRTDNMGQYNVEIKLGKIRYDLRGQAVML